MELTEELEDQREALRQLVRTRKAKKAIIIAIIAFLLVSAFAFMNWQNAKMRETIAEQQQQIADMLENPIVVNPVAPKIELDVIYEDIRMIGELATVEYLFTDAAHFSDSQQIGNWNIPFTEKSFNMKWDGVIKAGIQVDEILIEVDEDNKKIVVTIPPAQILSYEVDNESIELFDEKNNIFNKISVNDKIQVDIATEKEMKDRAIRNGLLDQAQENAKDVISRLLSSYAAIGSDYEIIFQIAE